jgi:hypothetical protein
MSNQRFQSESFYIDLSETIHALSGMILFNFAQHDCKKKDVILRNFVARSATSLKSIMALWELGDHPNAWVINRTMLDRLFHLNDLGKNETHDLFDDWSFYRQYKDQNRLKSDIEFKDKVTGSEYELSQEQKERFKELSNNLPNWKRPNAEAVAKDMDMTFLYKYGYDYASKFVHPMSDDGLHDFYLITKLEPAEIQPSHISVLSNSVLASTMIIQEAINQSSFSWRRIVFDCIDQIRSAIDTGDNSYLQTMVKIIHMYKDMSLNEEMSA